MLAVVHAPAPRTEGGRPVKSSREWMDIVNAYAAVGTYRGAAALCGTTHKTVKRVLERRRLVSSNRVRRGRATRSW